MAMPLLGAAVTGLMALLLRSPENRACMSDMLSRTAHDLGDVLTGASSVVAGGTAVAARGAGGAAHVVGQAAKPLSGLVAGGVTSLLAHGSDVIDSLSDEEDEMMDRTSRAVRDATRTARRAMSDLPKGAEVRNMIKNEVSRQISKQFDRHERTMDQRLKQHFSDHDEALHRLTDQLDHLTVTVRPRKSGGIPWSLIAMGGVGYYLYSNKQARQQLMDSLNQLMGQEAKQNLQRAGESLRQGVKDLQQGEDPRPALRDAADGAKQAAQKAVSNAQQQAQSTAQDVKQQAQSTAQDVKQQAQSTAQDVKQQAQSAAQQSQSQGQSGQSGRGGKH